MVPDWLYSSVRAGALRYRDHRYTYAIHDESNNEIISWHRHPKRTPDVEHPHLHIGPGTFHRRAELHRAHIPTGIVSVAEVIRCATTDFHVEPRREDWQRILGSDI